MGCSLASIRSINSQQVSETTRPTPSALGIAKVAREEAQSARVPAKEFLDQIPTSVAANLLAVIDAVAKAPPPAFAGGGKWEAMHGDMAGFYEARADGPGRTHYRLFCILVRNGADVGLGGPSIVIICGKQKPFRSQFAAREYGEVKKMAGELRSAVPWSVER